MCWLGRSGSRFKNKNGNHWNYLRSFVQITSMKITLASKWHLIKMVEIRQKRNALVFFWLFASGPKRPMKSQSPRVDAQDGIGRWIRWILVRCIQYYTYCRVENISLTSFKFLLRCFSCADHQSNVTGAERENALLRRPILLWFTTSW